MRYAAIDIGTVTCRLLVADVDETGIHDLCRRSEIVNLGAGVDASGNLSADAVDRVCTVVEEYLAIVKGFSDAEPVQVRCMATSASRDACNADEFARRLAELGADLAIIPGQREAGLSFLGASSAYEGERLLVADIGGGSTELVAGVAGSGVVHANEAGGPAADGLIGVAGSGVVHAHSFNIGCRRATERLLHSDPPEPAELDALASWVKGEFEGFFDELASMGFEPQRLVVVAGTATSIVSIDEALDPYDPDFVHGYRVDVAAVERVFERLAGMTLEQREQVVGLQPKRAPLIVAGVVILRQILELSGLPAYYASETDILEGIILDAVAHPDGC